VSSAIAPTVAVGPSPSKPNEGSVRTDSVVLSNPIPSEGVSIRSQDQAHVQKPDETSILAEAEKPSEQVLATTTRTEDLNPTNPETNVMKNGATVLGSGVCSTAEVSPGRVDSGSLSTPAENRYLSPACMPFYHLRKTKPHQESFSH
jgi:hypothetical protein